MLYGRNKIEVKRFPQPLGDVDRTYADITHGQGVLGYAPSTMLEEWMVKEHEWLRETSS